MGLFVCCGVFIVMGVLVVVLLFVVLCWVGGVACLFCSVYFVFVILLGCGGCVVLD